MMIDTLSRGFDAFSGGLRQIAAGYDRTILFTTGSLDAGCDSARRQLPHSWKRSLPDRFRNSLKFLLSEGAANRSSADSHLQPFAGGSIMKAVSAVLGVTTVMKLLLSPAGESRAGGLIECNNCPSPSDAALASGEGLTVVVDFERAELTAFDVEHEPKAKKWRAHPTPVPAQIETAFLRILDATLSAGEAPLMQQSPHERQ
ncbi:hypothetical protein [Stenotrophomonas maltophilia]|uniref:hypothetical protein n=2 Tax=Stenotrophomonas maltophilia TaxID=40324 RepID=UPI001146660B|nr:hypothetical protein [Stenotrophomonas maltophilia]